MIKSTQKVDIFAKRIAKHSGGRLTPVNYFEWHKSDTAKAVKSLTAIELHFIATENDRGEVCSKIIQPLAASKACPITRRSSKKSLAQLAGEAALAARECGLGLPTK